MKKAKTRFHFEGLAQPRDGEFSLTAVGDCIWSQKFDHEPALFAVMRESDITFANFEQALTTTVAPKTLAAPLSLAHPRILAEFKEAGIKVVSAANNHFMDDGEEGIEVAMLALKRSDIEYTGAGRTLAEAIRPAVMTVGKTKVAFIAFLVSTELTTPQADIKHAGVAGIRGFEVGNADQLDPSDLSVLIRTIQALKAQGYFVIVSFHFHWGNFLIRFPDYVVDRGEEAVAHGSIDTGADLVIGHGPHVLAPIEIYKGKPILYSLGHFVFQLDPKHFSPEIARRVQEMKQHPRSRESMIFRCVIDPERGVRAIELLPVAISMDGAPQLPGGTMTDGILTSIEELCAVRGSAISRYANYATLDLTRSGWTRKRPQPGKNRTALPIFDEVSPVSTPIRALELKDGAFNRGSFLGAEKEVRIELRISGKDNGEIDMVSGDISQPGNSGLEVTSFVCPTPQETKGGNTITGAIIVRAPAVALGTLRLEMEPNGVGFVQIHLEGEAAPMEFPVVWQGQYIRRLTIEIDGLETMPAPGSYKSRTGQVVTLKNAYENAGFDVNLEIDMFRGGPSSDTDLRGFSEAELVAVLEQRQTNRPADAGLQTHLFIATHFAGRQARSVLGLMYDVGRRGAAIFYHSPVFGDPRVSLLRRDRYFVMTAVHEIAHTLNLPHCFDAERPAALSWTNYPNYYPYGAQQQRGIRDEFWRRFAETFDPQELRFLWHAAHAEIAAGKLPFTQYESGLSLLMGGEDLNPPEDLHEEPSASFSIQPVKDEYYFGEPVFVELRITNNGPAPLLVPTGLSPAEGKVLIEVCGPDRRTRRYRPPSSFCMLNESVELPPGNGLPPVEGLPLFLSAGGATFDRPGHYELQATLLGVNGASVARSPKSVITVREPDGATKRLAEELFSNPRALTALHFRHPLIAEADWNKAEDAVLRRHLAADNTTLACFNYVKALGWSNAFIDAGSRREKGANAEKARKSLKEINPEFLRDEVRSIPRSHKRRANALIEQIDRGGQTPTVSRHLVAEPERKMRMEISPSGVFGTAGLDLSKRNDQLRFVDVVSWDMRALKKYSDRARATLAEAIRSFRCDFWGVICDDLASLKALVADVNDSRDVQYDFIAGPVEGKGEGTFNAGIFRSDLVELNALADPEDSGGILLHEVRVKLTDRSRVLDVCCAVANFDNGGSFDFGRFRKFAGFLNAFRTEIVSDLLVVGDIPFQAASQALSQFDALNLLQFATISRTDGRANQRTVIRLSSVELLRAVTPLATVCEGTFEPSGILQTDSDIASWFDPGVPLPVPVRLIV